MIKEATNDLLFILPPFFDPDHPVRVVFVHLTLNFKIFIYRERTKCDMRRIN